ncbi:MAG: dihydrolipoamide acetyltransferase family protein [Planctomycetota bacterium]
MSEFRMPSLGADMEAGTLVAWLKAPGDRLAKGDAIASVDTDKGVIDVEVFHPGVLEELLVPPGTRVPVGAPLARIREAGEPARGAGLQPAESAPPAPRPRGAGLQPAVPTPEPAPPASAAERMRRTIAAAMARSKREIPHYYLWTTIDLDRAMRWLARVNADRPIGRRLLPGVLLVKATALALEEFPEFSAVWEHDRLELRRPAHVGIAISLRAGGLVVLALHDTASRSLDDLMAGVADLTARARTGRMRSSELADSTITVTSLGDRGVDAVLGVIYPPQVALVGFGRIVERPWAAAGQAVVRPVVTVSLAADHRASDGHRGGLLLDAIDRLLQEPERL